MEPQMPDTIEQIRDIAQELQLRVRNLKYGALSVWLNDGERILRIRPRTDDGLPDLIIRERCIPESYKHLFESRGDGFNRLVEQSTHVDLHNIILAFRDKLTAN
jgi:hypothetical protein